MLNQISAPQLRFANEVKHLEVSVVMEPKRRAPINTEKLNFKLEEKIVMTDKKGIPNENRK